MSYSHWLDRGPTYEEVVAHELTHGLGSCGGANWLFHWSHDKLLPEIVRLRDHGGCIARYLTPDELCEDDFEPWRQLRQNPWDGCVKVLRCVPCDVDGVPAFYVNEPSEQRFAKYWTPDNLCGFCQHPRDCHLGQAPRKSAGTCIYRPCICTQFVEPVLK